MQRTVIWLLLIAFIAAVAGYVVWPGSAPVLARFGRPGEFLQGLDLRGGVQVTLEADVAPGTPLDPESMNVARSIVEQRVNALGLTEPLVQLQGDQQNLIVAELPGVSDPETAIATIKETGLLEFVHAGSQTLSVGDILVTDCADPSQVDCGAAAGATSPDVAASSTQTTTYPGQVFHTIMTGAALQTARVEADQLGRTAIAFELRPEGTTLFSNYTRANIGQILAITLDKQVISAPVVEVAITDGRGIIQGQFSTESANRLALQLRYGSLPVPLKVVQTRLVGPSLGQDSLNKSLVAGLIGLTVVVLFMALYYRLSGAVADVAILFYALVTLAVFKLLPVTLTLAGIAGFMLSTGSALDANILIFERLKEELRAGRPLGAALAPAWRRAWPSIRDSNIATIIICLILFWFGSTFGASVVKGFALTLFIGVLISLFTALVVTRNLLTAVVSALPAASQRVQAWFGL